MKIGWLSTMWLCLGAYALGCAFYGLWTGDGLSLLWVGAGLSFWHEAALRKND
jgi:hypothetical protein